eukprot:1064416-Pleurochrysis_carterae.AAC.2
MPTLSQLVDLSPFESGRQPGLPRVVCRRGRSVVQIDRIEEPAARIACTCRASRSRTGTCLFKVLEARKTPTNICCAY